MQVAVYLVVLVLTVFGWGLPYLNHQLYSIFFIIMILNIASNPSSILKLELPVLHWLGKISYGIYMYHPITITIGLLLMNYAGYGHGAMFQLGVYSLGIVMTIALAGVSYHLYELPFLKLKDTFAWVISGDRVQSK